MSQNIPPNKQGLLQRIRDEYSNCLEILNQANSQDKQLELVGNWTIFDILKHLAGWAVWRVEATEDLIAKGVTDYSNLANIDDFNISIVSERSRDSWDQVVNELIDADETWIRLLDGLSEDVIFGGNEFKGPVWDTLDQWVKIAYEHYTHHANIVIKIL